MAYSPEQKRAYRKQRKAEGAPVPRGTGTPDPRVYVGIDTEGVTDEHGNHRTVMISYSDKYSTPKYTKVLKDARGLSSERLLDFIANIPDECTVFGYSFGYDRSKILQDLPNKSIYKLLRPHTRPCYANRPSQRKPVWYKHFALNMDNLCLSVRPWGDKTKHRPTAVWDVIRFCQAPFVAKACDCTPEKRATCTSCKGKGHGERGALEMWGVGTKAERDSVRAMKVQRAEFHESMLAEMEEYNLLECRLLADLVEKIISAHSELSTPTLPYGLTLRRFDGPGSSVTALFGAWGLKVVFQEMQALWHTEYPADLRQAILTAYFGGRFENNRIGRVQGFNYDINSAYPYQCCSLPCINHGRWTFTTDRKRVENATLGLVRYRLNKHKKNCKAWGPLPIRLEDGCICYPSASEGGWIWRDEYLTAERSGLWPGLEFIEGWVFERDCVCPNPLRNEAELYAERDRVGKGSGIGNVLKLVVNSTYGKCAQSVGRAPFNSWIYAGLITSGCRVQILEAIAAHKDPMNLVAIATDGILTTEELDLPSPRVTGAENCKKPLGGWDKETTPEIFLIRPGVYVGSKMKTRGITESTLKRIADKIVADWDRHHDTSRHVDAPGETRFIGARQAIYHVKEDDSYRRMLTYGNWVTRSQRVSFDPLPKRARALKSGFLTLRDMTGIESVAYKKGRSVNGEDGGPIEELRAEEEDQDDATEEVCFE